MITYYNELGEFKYDGKLIVEFKQRDDQSEIVNYDDENFPCFSFDGFLTGIEPWVRNTHWHDDIELLSVVSGTMAYNVNGQMITLNAGDTIFVNARNLHYSDGINRQLATYYVTVVHPSVLGSSKSVFSKYLLPVLSDKNLQYIVFKNGTKEAEEIQNYSQTIYENKLNPFEITRCLFEIWRHILNKHQSGNDEFTKTSGLNIECAKQMIMFAKANYQNKITLTEIANSGNVSKSTCNNIFKSYTGFTPSEFVIRYRIDRAIDLLQNTNDNISMISSKCGFTSPSYMAEQFMKCYGKSPRDFR